MEKDQGLGGREGGRWCRVSAWQEGAAAECQRVWQCWAEEGSKVMVTSLQ